MFIIILRMCVVVITSKMSLKAFKKFMCTVQTRINTYEKPFYVQSL